MRQQWFEESDTQNPAKLPGEDMLNQRADKDQKGLSAHRDLPWCVTEAPSQLSSEDRPKSPLNYDRKQREWAQNNSNY